MSYPGKGCIDDEGEGSKVEEQPCKGWGDGGFFRGIWPTFLGIFRLSGDELSLPRSVRGIDRLPAAGSALCRDVGTMSPTSPTPGDFGDITMDRWYVTW